MSAPVKKREIQSKALDGDTDSVSSSLSNSEDVEQEVRNIRLYCTIKHIMIPGELTSYSETCGRFLS